MKVQHLWVILALAACAGPAKDEDQSEGSDESDDSEGSDSEGTDSEGTGTEGTDSDSDSLADVPLGLWLASAFVKSVDSCGEAGVLPAMTLSAAGAGFTLTPKDLQASGVAIAGVPLACSGDETGVVCMADTAYDYGIVQESRHREIALSFTGPGQAEGTLSVASVCTGGYCEAAPDCTTEATFDARLDLGSGLTCASEAELAPSKDETWTLTIEVQAQTQSATYGLQQTSNAYFDVTVPNGAASSPTTTSWSGEVADGRYEIVAEPKVGYEDWLTSRVTGFAEADQSVVIRAWNREVFDQYMAAGGISPANSDQGFLEVQAFNQSGAPLTGAVVTLDQPHDVSFNLANDGGYHRAVASTGAATTSGGNVLFAHVCPGNAQVEVESGGVPCRLGPVWGEKNPEVADVTISADGGSLVRFVCPTAP